MDSFVTLDQAVQFFLTSAILFNQGDICQWRILATHGEKIVLNVTHLDIPASQSNPLT